MNIISLAAVPSRLLDADTKVSDPDLKHAALMRAARFGNASEVDRVLDSFKAGQQWPSVKQLVAEGLVSPAIIKTWDAEARGQMALAFLVYPPKFQLALELIDIKPTPLVHSDVVTKVCGKEHGALALSRVCTLKDVELAKVFTNAYIRLNDGNPSPVKIWSDLQAAFGDVDAREIVREAVGEYYRTNVRSGNTDLICRALVKESLDYGALEHVVRHAKGEIKMLQFLKYSEANGSLKSDEITALCRCLLEGANLDPSYYDPARSKDESAARSVLRWGMERTKDYSPAFRLALRFIASNNIDALSFLIAEIPETNELMTNSETRTTASKCAKEGRVRTALYLEQKGWVTLLTTDVESGVFSLVRSHALSNSLTHRTAAEIEATRLDLEAGLSWLQLRPDCSPDAIEVLGWFDLELAPESVVCVV